MAILRQRPTHAILASPPARGSSRRLTRPNTVEARPPTSVISNPRARARESPVNTSAHQVNGDAATAAWGAHSRGTQQRHSPVVKLNNRLVVAAAGAPGRELRPASPYRTEAEHDQPPQINAAGGQRGLARIARRRQQHRRPGRSAARRSARGCPGRSISTQDVTTAVQTGAQGAQYGRSCGLSLLGQKDQQRRWRA